jgi:hypothetical protein
MVNARVKLPEDRSEGSALVWLAPKVNKVLPTASGLLAQSRYNCLIRYLFHYLVVFK